MKPLPDSRSATPSRIKVLLLTDEMEVGGTQRQIVHVARTLDRSRFEPTVLYFRNESFFVDELKAAGVPVVRIEKKGRFDPAFVARLRNHLVRSRYDVVHCFSFSGELWGAVARRLVPPSMRPALVSSIRGTYEWYSAAQWRIKRWVSTQSSCVVANSRAGAAYACERMGRPECAVDVVYNGVQCEPPCEDAARELRWLLSPAGEPLILFVGRLVVHKDVPTLVRAFHTLRARGIGARLCVAGDGPLRAELESLVRALHLEAQVALIGERHDVANLIAASDFLVLPSLREGLSNVILEAMIGGRPVIASRTGGNVELVEQGRTGLLFEVGSEVQLVEAMSRLATDADLRRSLGTAARAVAEARYSVPAMVQSLERHYAAVSRRAPGASVRVTPAAG